MLILIPTTILLITAAILAILGVFRPNFKYSWLIAAAGSSLGLVIIFIWHFGLPHAFSLAPWQPARLLFFTPTWLVDNISWPYAIGLIVFTTAAILTSIVRSEKDSSKWMGILAISSIGILAVISENPITLLLAWTANDLIELVIFLGLADNDSQIKQIFLSFSLRLIGSGLLLWSSLQAAAGGILMTFRAIPENSELILLAAIGFRLVAQTTNLPYRKEKVISRSFGTSFTFVSAASSLTLLARLPISTAIMPSLPYLFILAAVTGLFAGIKWLFASDEMTGRQFWVLALASLAMAATLRADPTGSVGWGVALLLSGGGLFLFSARQRTILWLPLLGALAFTSLPFSLTAASWSNLGTLPWLSIFPFIPIHAMLLAGFIRFTFHPGEASFGSQEKWTKIIYPLGLALPAAFAILLGFWGWQGAGTVGRWWISLLIIGLCIVFFVISRMKIKQIELNKTNGSFILKSIFFGINKFFSGLVNVFQNISETISFSLEGEGGLLWAFLLLALFLSIFASLMN